MVADVFQDFIDLFLTLESTLHLETELPSRARLTMAAAVAQEVQVLTSEACYAGEAMGQLTLW